MADKESILDRIAKQRRLDSSAAESQTSCQALKERADTLASELGPPLNLHTRLSNNRTLAAADATLPKLSIAGEFKRASPSKGNIALSLDAGEQGLRYANAGASVISVLTEPTWFKGSMDDLLDVRRKVADMPNSNRPLILRKDFVISEHMLYEARAYGADTVLLICAILDQEELAGLLAKSRELGMEPLVEVANTAEMHRALDAGSKVIGVNNRNLHTFKVDMTTTTRMVDVARQRGAIAPMGSDDDPEGVLVVALSGVRNRADVVAYEKHGGVCGILVGETLMRAADPGRMIRSLVAEGEERVVVRVKVCGVREPEDALVAAQAGADFIGVIFAKGSKRMATVAQAQAVVKAIRTFREQDEVNDENGEPPLLVTPPSSLLETDTASQRLGAWSRSLDDACAGRSRPLVVGVFMNQDPEEVADITKEVGLDIVQLHGSEGWEAAGQCSRPCIRVVHVPAAAGGEGSEAGAKAVMEQLQGGKAGPACVLLDTSVKGEASGGTGVAFDWNIAALVGKGDEGVPVMLAGGLNAENVAEAVKVARPWCVDVASGVEASPGVKDHDKVRAFITNAKSA